MITILYAFFINKIPDTVEPSTIWYIAGATILVDAFLVVVAWTLVMT